MEKVGAISSRHTFAQALKKVMKEDYGLDFTIYNQKEIMYFY